MIRSDISNVVNKQKHRVIVECDIKVATTCKIRFECSVRSLEKTRKNNEGKDICNKCASRLKNSGSDNHAFKHKKNENYFEIIDSEVKAYLLGWIASDGCIHPDSFCVELHEKDKEILELFQKEICPSALITKRKNRNTCWIAICSKKICFDLCKHLNVEPKNKQNKLRLPALQFHLMRHFIRGFLDGDGWIRSKRVVCGIGSIDPILVGDFVNYSLSVGIKACKCDKWAEWNGRYCVQFLNHLYQNSNYRLSRKYKLYQEKL